MSFLHTKYLQNSSVSANLELHNVAYTTLVLTQSLYTLRSIVTLLRVVFGAY